MKKVQIHVAMKKAKDLFERSRLSLDELSEEEYEITWRMLAALRKLIKTWAKEISEKHIERPKVKFQFLNPGMKN